MSSLPFLMCLIYVYWQMEEEPIKTFYSRCYGKTCAKYNNFGDELPLMIIPKVFGRKIVWSYPPHSDMMSVGSIIEMYYKDRGENKEEVVWTSGFMRNASFTIGEDFKVVAVRGKLSLSRITGVHNHNVVVGDLGLLASCVLDEKDVEKIFKVGIIPHWKEYLIVNILFKGNLFKSDLVKIISPKQRGENVIFQISQCDSILSSSLHGLIVADSLYIPNCYLQIGNRVKEGGMYKYHDYYSVFSKYRLKTVHSHIFKEDLSPQQLMDIVVSGYVEAKDEVDVIKLLLIDSFNCVEYFLGKCADLKCAERRANKEKRKIGKRLKKRKDRNR